MPFRSEHSLILRPIALGTFAAILLFQSPTAVSQHLVPSEGRAAFLLAQSASKGEQSEQRTSPGEHGAKTLATVPVLHKGDRWGYQVLKQLKRRVAQKVSVVEIAMTYDNMTGRHAYEVLGTVSLSGTTCYEVEVTGRQRLTGTYRTSVAGDPLLSSTGPLTETQTLEGREYWRVSDLALVRRVLEITSATQFMGDLARNAPDPIPDKATLTYTPDPPVRDLRFPLLEGEDWNVSSTATISISREAGSVTHTETISYANKVTGSAKLVLGDENLDVVVLSRTGMRTEESATGEVSIEKIDGKVYYSPRAKCIVLDEADGKRLLTYHVSE